MDFAQLWNAGLSYSAFLDHYASPSQRMRWDETARAVQLSSSQQQTLAHFRRRMPVVVMAGAWCGDCSAQCPIFEAFDAACPQIETRYYDRDDHPQLGQYLKTCGAARVPTVLFLSEDFTDCGRYGDRTLAKYRELGASLDGAACPSGLVEPTQRLAAIVSEWLDQFERIQWILRTSPRLRALHGD